MDEQKLLDIGLRENQIPENQLVESRYAAFRESYAAESEVIYGQFMRFVENGTERDVLEDAEIKGLERFCEMYGDFFDAFGESIIRLQTPLELYPGFMMFANQASSLRNIGTLPYRNNFLMMQRTGIMAQTAHFLYQLYQAHVAPQQSVFTYMDLGARHLGYTREKLYKRLIGVIRMKNGTDLIGRLLNAFLHKNLRGPFPPCNDFTNKGTAMADYPYTFQPAHSKSLRILPISLNGSLIARYDVNDCSLMLGKGEQAALFSLGDEYQDRTILSFAGTDFHFTTRMLHNVVTDVSQILFGPETTYLAAVGLLKDVLDHTINHVWVLGHSLGGGLMQFACTALSDNRNYAQRLHGIGYNSAGLSNRTMRTLTAKRERTMAGRIRQVRSTTDIVSRIGHLIGQFEYVDTHKRFSHSIDDLNMTMNGRLMSCYTTPYIYHV